MNTKRMNNYSKEGGTKKRLFVGGTVYRGREGEREKVNVAQFFFFGSTSMWGKERYWRVYEREGMVCCALCFRQWDSAGERKREGKKAAAAKKEWLQRPCSPKRQSNEEGTRWKRCTRWTNEDSGQWEAADSGGMRQTDKYGRSRW